MRSKPGHCKAQVHMAAKLWATLVVSDTKQQKAVALI